MDNLEDLEFENCIIKDDEEVVVKKAKVDDQITPYLGLEFRTPDEEYTFYNSYACRVGFSVHIASQGNNRNDVLSIRYVCSKEEFSNSQKTKKQPIRNLTTQKTPEKEKGILRVSCKASCRIILIKDGIWQVSIFTENYNHDLITSPSKKRNLRS